MALLSPTIRQRFFDQNGDPLVGGKLWTYTGGSSTPKISYSDQAATAANTNPPAKRNKLPNAALHGRLIN